MNNTDSRIQNINNLLKTANMNVQKAQRLLTSLTADLKNSYDDVPGVKGIFDGEKMIAEDGKEYEINPNYVAKSLLVVGDGLKMIEEDGKPPMFKQVTKVPRKHMEGILNKKEGIWHALTDSGSYRVLDVAVEFRKAEVNDEILVQVPEDNLNAPYAALEKLMNEDKKEKKEEKDEKPVLKKKIAKVSIKKVTKVAAKKPTKAPEEEISEVVPKVAPKSKASEGESSEVAAKEKKSEYALDDDDLR